MRAGLGLGRGVWFGAPVGGSAGAIFGAVLLQGHSATAASGGHRNKLRHLLSWSEPAQGLSRSAVELGCDAIEFGLVVQRQARARGDEFRRYTWSDVFEQPKQMLTELRALLPPIRL